MLIVETIRKIRMALAVCCVNRIGIRVFPAKIANFLFFILLLAIDRVTKYWALSSLRAENVGQAFLSLELHFNSGVMFSFLEGHAFLSFVVALVALLALVFACIRSERLRSMRGLMPLWAGAVSNFTDRIIHGHVIDWIRIGGVYMNLADLYLFIGYILICFQCFKIFRRSEICDAEKF